MSQLLGRMGKLSSSWSSIGKQGLRFSELRLFSTMPTPYLLLGDSNYKRGASGEVTMDINLYDPRKQEKVIIPDQTLPKELNHRSLQINSASSRGWVGFQNIDDCTIRITNIFNPSASVSSHKVISLPPLGRYKNVFKFSLSASPNQQDDEDCVVAVRTTNSSSLFLCRLGDSKWTHVNLPITDTDFQLMYSERDRRFYLLMDTRQSHGSIDLIDTSCSYLPQASLYQSFPLSDIPNRSGKGWHFLMCFINKHFSRDNNPYLVESPSGESFVVYWWKDLLESVDNRHVVRPPYQLIHQFETRAFVVFRQDPERRIGSYTEDIGDLCIFLTENDAFCVSATKYPGLNPNCIYFASYTGWFGFYDISSDTIFYLNDEDPSLSEFCMWLAPLE